MILKRDLKFWSLRTGDRQVTWKTLEHTCQQSLQQDLTPKFKEIYEFQAIRTSNYGIHSKDFNGFAQYYGAL